MNQHIKSYIPSFGCPLLLSANFPSTTTYVLYNTILCVSSCSKPCNYNVDHIMCQQYNYKVGNAISLQ